MNIRFVSLLLALIVPATATMAATDIAGIKFEDTAKVGAGETALLQLNGGGLRKKVFFKVYAMGLYLPQKVTTAADALAAPGAKRIELITLRDLTAEQLVEALLEALKKNHDEAALATLQTRIDSFRTAMLSIASAPEKSVVQIDWLPGTGTRLSFMGKPMGTDIPGEDFYRALMRIWLGDHPAQDDLKDKLLGKLQ